MAEANDAPLTLRILTPAGIIAEEHGDSVKLQLSDGSLGIRKGHRAALAALSDGDVVLKQSGSPIGRWHTPGGFASIENNIITVITDQAERL